MSIPCVIHYCWFGGNPLPTDAVRCIESWRKHMPQCEIKLWNEHNFDVNINSYTAEAYRLKKYAFVSDYARMWILYNYGGIYFDTDVEVIAPLNDILARGPFMGLEAPKSSQDTPMVALGLGMACKAGNTLLKELLDIYEHLHMVSPLGKHGGTIVEITWPIIARHTAITHPDGTETRAGFTIYPPEYFCPLNYYTRQMAITEHTHTIHHYAATWVNGSDSITDKLKRRMRGIWARWATKCTKMLKNKKKSPQFIEY